MSQRDSPLHALLSKDVTTNFKNAFHWGSKMAMFLETIRSEGINHLSYILGNKNQAVVIDPRRDCKVYVSIANRHSSKITHIFETHRHEDFVVGSLELAKRTKAKIYHGDALTFDYGYAAKDGETFNVGDFTLKVIETPGHTPESICITVTDNNYGKNKPVAVFTGDTLLVGGTGRVDLFHTLSNELAENLYNSIHNKILPLGDQAIIYPAHGHNLIYGSSFAEREFSTIGYEREFNPALQKNKRDFIKSKLAEEHYYAPYFRQMEHLNQVGVPLYPKLPKPRFLDAEEFSAVIDNKEIMVLDVRSPEAFAGAHIAKSLSIPLPILSNYAGWFLPYKGKIGLVAGQDQDIEKALIILMRLGYDNISYYLSGHITAWSCAGKPLVSIPAIDTATLYSRMESTENVMVLDVRNRDEYIDSPAQNARKIWLGELPKQSNNLPQDKKIITLCGTGYRASLAASILKQNPNLFSNVEICLGCASSYIAIMPTVRAAQ